MAQTPEAKAREEIDRLLTAAGWHVCGVKDANIHAARGVAIREFPLAQDFGYADCWRRPNFDRPCRLNIDQGSEAVR